MTAYILLSLGLVVLGVVIGEVHACGWVVFRDARERVLDTAYDARRWLARKVMRAGGEHADPRETGPMNVLPDDTPPDGTPVLGDKMIGQVRREYAGKHAKGLVPREPGATLNRAPWPTGSFELPADVMMVPAAQAVRHPCCWHCITEDTDTCDPRDMHLVACADCAPQYGQAPVTVVDEAQSGAMLP